MSVPILISGWGVICALGVGPEAVWTALRQGKSGLREITGFDPEPYRSQLAGEVLDFAATDWLLTPKTYLDPATAFTLAAGRMALEGAGFDLPLAGGEQFGIVLGTAYGCLPTMYEYWLRAQARGIKFASSLLFSHSLANTPTSLAAIEYNLRGHHTTVTAGLVSSGQAVVNAVLALRDGRADAILAGGVEVLSEPLFAGLQPYLSPLDDGPEGCRPFAPTANGTVLGEGTALLILERMDRAQHRGLSPAVEVRGVFQSSFPLGLDGHRDSLPEVKATIQAALADANLTVGEVEAVIAGANGHPTLDAVLAAALRELVGDRVPVTAPKALWGEAWGAGDALNLIAALCALHTGWLPPTPDANSEELDLVTEPRPWSGRTVLVVGLDFSGAVIAVLLCAA